MALGHTRGHVSEAQLRKNFKLAGVMFTAIALLTTFWAWGEINKAYFGPVYDAQLVGKRQSSSGRTTYHIRYSYVENGVKRVSLDNVDFSKYQRFAAPTTAATAPTGKVKVGKALGFYFDEYFEGEFQPERFLVIAIAVCAILANLLAVYFWIRPSLGRLSDPVEAKGNQLPGASPTDKALNASELPNPNLIVQLVRAKGPLLTIVFILALLFFSWIPAILIWTTLLTLDAVYWGKAYDATIVRKYTSASESSSKSTTRYNIEYSYEPGGHLRTADREVSAAQFSNITVPARTIDGQPITVRVSERLGRYWPEMLLPGETKGDRVSDDILLCTIACAIFLIPDAILIAIWRYLRRLKQRQLQSQSQVASPAATVPL